MVTAADILADLKDRDAESRKNDPGNFGVVILLKQDPAVARLVACFQNVPVGAAPDPALRCPENISKVDRIRWYWSRLTPDPIPAWIKVSGLPDAPYVRRAIQVAIDNRMVHPDGAVSTWTNAFLLDYVKQVLGAGS